MIKFTPEEIAAFEESMKEDGCSPEFIESALKEYRGEEPEVSLPDYQMPEINALTEGLMGFELAFNKAFRR